MQTPTLQQLLEAGVHFGHQVRRGHPRMRQYIYGARDGGAYGAKLSGAGGGDCMIAVAPKDKISAVQEGIRKAGGEIIQVKTHVDGVTVENA